MASRVARIRSISPGSRRTRATRARALRWSAPAPSGASSRNRTSTGWPSSASKSTGLSSRATRPKICGRGPAACRAGWRCRRRYRWSRGARAAAALRRSRRSSSPSETRRLGGEFLKGLLFAADAQGGQNGLRVEKIQQGHRSSYVRYEAVRPRGVKAAPHTVHKQNRAKKG